MVVVIVVLIVVMVVMINMKELDIARTDLVIQDILTRCY